MNSDNLASYSTTHNSIISVNYIALKLRNNLFMAMKHVFIPLLFSINLEHEFFLHYCIVLLLYL